MPEPVSRRDVLKRLGAAGAGLVFGGGIPGREEPVELAVSSLSPVTVRLVLRRAEGGRVPVSRSVRAGSLLVRFTAAPPTVEIETARGALVQRFTLDTAAPALSFLLGLGEGGPQFDRKGWADRMINGQGGYRLATHGTRAPIQWLIGTAGWAMFIQQPYGGFDFTGREGKFTPPAGSALPLDLFITASSDPRVIMREYARISGFPELPALWTFGYQQSHRTLGGPEEIMSVARTFREKKLPCDALIYLGTEFSPSGWNTRNGEFTWHTGNFPNPKQMLDALHAEHFKVVLHIVIEGRHLTGSVQDPCTAPSLPSGRTLDNRWPPERQVACYWPFHKPLMEAGVDGWWPDQGDGLDGPSELNRHRMYWEGSQLYRPNQRPYALHRNASVGVQRYGGFIWSGDIQTRWETLKTHVAVALNTGLSGLPYWGTDIGGFIPTAEYTGELQVRWFQFGAFCPLFRAHGRHWHLRLPWGWDGGDGGPLETTSFRADPAELHNPEVERICREYLELRYRLLPYLYTAARECHDTGMPLMRALWLHYPNDPAAVARGDEYLWGPDLLVAPVVEKGATSRRLYLPRGNWFDWWTEERVAGGREADRAVDLATTPLYVRAGAVVPLGPVKQYADEPSDAPLTLLVYPGGDGESSWYEDDGQSFNYRRGEWQRVMLRWHDAARRLSLRLANGSRLLGPAPRRLLLRVAGSSRTRSIEFSGRPIEVTL